MCKKEKRRKGVETIHGTISPRLLNNESHLPPRIITGEKKKKKDRRYNESERFHKLVIQSWKEHWERTNERSRREGAGKTWNGDGDRNRGETTFNYGTERGGRVRRGERRRKNGEGAARIRGTTDVFNYICSTTRHRCLITPRCREARLPRNALAVSMPRL